MFSAKTNTKWIEEKSHTKLDKNYTITVPYDTFTQWATENRSAKVVKGFRPGQAPLSAFKDDWMLACVREVADEIIKQEKFANLLNSTYTIKTFELGKNVEIGLHLELYPEVPEIDFSSIKLQHHVAKITEKEAKEAIKGWTAINFKPAKLQDPRPIQENDFVNVSIELTDPKGHKERMNSMNIQIGKRTFLPEIEQKLIGHNIGDTVEHEFAIPAGNPLIKDSNLVGKEVKISFKINEVVGAENLTTTDMLTVFQVASEEELEKKFKANLELEATRWSEHLLKEGLKKELEKQFFEIPMSLLHAKYRAFRAQVLSDIGFKDGDNLEEQVKNVLKMEMEDFERRIIFAAESMARVSFLINHFGRIMGVMVAPSELDDEIAKQKQLFPEGLQAAVKFFEENPQAKENLRNSIFENKTLVALVSKCALERIEHPLNEFYSVNPFKQPEIADEESEKIEETSEKPAKKAAKKSETQETTEE